MTIDELLADHEGGHSDLQMDAFITIRSGGTPYGCYKQALRELAKRKRGVDGLAVERDLLLIDVEELEASGDRRDKIRLRQKLQYLEYIDRAIADTQRELERFHAQAELLKQLVGNLTPQRRYQLECEMWMHRLKCRAAMDYMRTCRLEANTLELIQALPLVMRDELTKGTAKELVEWFQGYEPPVPLGIAYDPPLRLAEPA